MDDMEMAVADALIKAQEKEIATLKLQNREAMKACPWVTHDVDHREPKDCVNALSALLQLRALESQQQVKRNDEAGHWCVRSHDKPCPKCGATQ